jgi:predicted RNase H-like HicB family nuclease
VGGWEVVTGGVLIHRGRVHAEYAEGGEKLGDEKGMKTYTAVVERSPETGLFVGFIPGVSGAHTQAESLNELNANLREVLALLAEGGEPEIEAVFAKLP